MLLPHCNHLPRQGPQYLFIIINIIIIICHIVADSAHLYFPVKGMLMWRAAALVDLNKQCLAVS